MSTPLRRSGAPVDELDRRIIGALQVDGRASWRTIAEALGESERTVTRRGARLLNDRVVRVVGKHVRGTGVLVRAQCAPGMLRVTAKAWAARAESTFTYILTGETGAVGELYVSAENLTSLVVEDLPGTPGVVRCWISPVLHYYKTVHQWQPGILTQAEVARLGAPEIPHTPPANDDTLLSPADHAMLRVLADNGRATYDELGRAARVSETSARRAVATLRRAGQVYLRALVDPSAVGFPVQAMLWLRTAPADTERVGRQLAASPIVRYVAGLLGEYQILAQATTESVDHLQRFLTAGPWVSSIQGMETCLVVETLKSTGVPIE